MNIIDRGNKSLVEKAVERLAASRQPSSSHPARDIRPMPAVDATTEHPAARRTRGMVEIDFERLRANGFALPGDQSELAEELRLVKRPLLTAALARNGQARNSNLIMVTSANSNEGKTFTATNLAFSIASEHDLHVLLIDGDVANPTIPSVFGFTAEIGLLDVVSDTSVELADALFRTSIPNLSILPSGRPRPGSSELFASARMARFIDEIANRYPDRIVIFDSPPVLARSEALVLAQHIDQVVFVVAAERTLSSVVREAIGLIGPKKLGSVLLNKAPPATSKYGYHYYYGTGQR
jgi:protein-tyrosine kinase